MQRIVDRRYLFSSIQFDNEVKSTKRYAKVLTVMIVVFASIIGSFAIYSYVYFGTKNKLEKNFAEQLEENHFYKNIDGAYSMDYADGVTYSVPNQAMPRLTDFSLHFHLSNVYCDIELDDTRVTIVWEDYNKFEVITVSKTDEKIRGDLFLSEEGYPANIKELALYKDFY